MELIKLHTVWKGALSFGLVHMPIKMHSATEDKDIAMKNLHRDCASNLSYVKTCTSCKKEVLSDEIVKGYEYGKNSFVIFDDNELEQLASESSKEIKIIDFVDLRDIDPIYFQKTYYLSPDDNAGRAYSLFTEALKSTGKIGLSTVSLRSKSSLAVVRVIGKCLVMETMHYYDEIRQIENVPNLPHNIEINDKELLMAQSLINQLSVPFVPEKYQDEYRNRFLNLVQNKINGNIIHVPQTQESTNVLDLMSALQASLDALNKKEISEEKPKRKKRKKLA